MGCTLLVVVVVVVVLVATSVDRGVLASDDCETKNSSSISKCMSLQPNENKTMKIKVTANTCYGTLGVEVTLNKTCFPTGYNKCYPLLANVSKLKKVFHFILSVGSCEASCESYGKSDLNCTKGINEINVIPINLKECNSTSEKSDDKTDVITCEVKLKENTIEKRSTNTSPTKTNTKATDKRSQDKLNSTPRPTTGKIPTEAKILLTVLAVQILGTWVMAVVVVVVIRRSSRKYAAFIKLVSKQELLEDSTIFEA